MNIEVSDGMCFVWKDYDNIYQDIIEGWLDLEARQMTGIDDSFVELYRYWQEHTDTHLGEKLWCKVIIKQDKPVAVILIGGHSGKFTVSELIVAPEFRGKGVGTSVLTELLKYSFYIIGQEIVRAGVVIFPDNRASQRAFEKAGFVFERVHLDGDAMYYKYRKEV